MIPLFLVLALPEAPRENHQIGKEQDERGHVQGQLVIGRLGPQKKKSHNKKKDGKSDSPIVLFAKERLHTVTVFRDTRLPFIGMTERPKQGRRYVLVEKGSRKFARLDAKNRTIQGNNGLALYSVAFVGLNNLTNKSVPHDILQTQLDLPNAFNASKDAAGVGKSGFLTV